MIGLNEISDAVDAVLDPLDSLGGDTRDRRLEPRVLAALIDDAIAGIVDMDLLEEQRRVQEIDRARLQAVSDRWGDVAAMLEDD